MEEIKIKIIKQMLLNAPELSWGDKNIEQSCKQLGLGEEYAEIAFPNKITDASFFLNSITNKMMAERFIAQQPDEIKIREKIKALIMCKFYAYNELAGANDAEANEHLHSSPFKAVNGYLLLPFHTHKGFKMIATTVDEMWYLAGDISTDFNYYTKRALLAGVYSSSLIKWLDDESKNFEETQNFVEERINEVLKIPKVKAKIGAIIEDIPNNIPFLRNFYHN